MSESCRREIVLWRSKHISNLVSLLKLFSPVLSVSGCYGEELVLHFGENVSRRISEGRPEYAVRKQRIARGKRKERNRQQKEEEACRGRSGNGRRRRRTESTDTKKP